MGESLRCEDLVVGAGAGGCVAAVRLASRGRRVLLVEAGRNVEPSIEVPVLGKAPADDDWGIEAELSLGGRSRALWLPRGRTVGGTSLIHGGIALRPPPADFERWAAVAGSTWSYAAVLPHLKSIENDLDIVDEGHGNSGPVAIRRARPDEMQPIHLDFIAACLGAGTTWCNDLNGSDPAGIGLTPLAREGDRPLNVLNTYLPLVRGRHNLSILPDTCAMHLRLNGTSVEAVDFVTRDERALQVYPDRVILAAGALGTAAILLQSGIGPVAELARANIPIGRPLPAVGATLRDHPTLHLWAPLVRGTGQPGRPWFQVMMRELSDLDAAGASFAIEIFHDFMLAPSPSALNRVIVTCMLLNARGLGSVRLDPASRAPRVSLDYSNVIDHNALAHAVEFTTSLFETNPLAAMIGQPLRWVPTSRWSRGVPTRQQVIAAFKAVTQSGPDAIPSHIVSGHHLHGTCPMGTGPDHSVVGPDCRVHTIDNLYLADASVIPVQIRVNTHLATLLVAEIVASRLQ